MEEATVIKSWPGFWKEVVFHTVSWGWGGFVLISGFLPDICDGLRWFPSIAAIPWVEWVKDNQLLFRLSALAVLVVMYVAYAPYVIYKKAEARHAKELGKFNDLLAEKNEEAKKSRAQRVERVVEKYLAWSGARETGCELQAFQLSGVATLHDEGEIEDAIMLIRSHGRTDPLKSPPGSLIPQGRRLEFFMAVTAAGQKLDDEAMVLDFMLKTLTPLSPTLGKEAPLPSPTS